MKTRNPYAPLSPGQAFFLAVGICSQWKMVSIKLDATLPGAAHKKRKFTTDMISPLPDGPPAWGEINYLGQFIWHNGNPPVQVGIICDLSWNPIIIYTKSRRKLPILDSNFEECEG